MGNLTKVKRRWFAALAVVLSAALIFTMTPFAGTGVSHAASEPAMQVQEPAVVLTGQGLIGGEEYTKDTVGMERSWSLEELQAMEGVTGQLYSAKKQKAPYTKSYFIADGVKVSSLLDPDAYTDEISFIASDGYSCSFQKGAKYVNPSDTKAAGLGSGRYLYDGFTAQKTQEVPAILSWAYAAVEGFNGEPPTEKPAAVQDKKGKLRLIVGQYDGDGGGAEDMNQPLYNGNEKDGIRKIQVGSPISQTALTIGKKAYTRADILLMPFGVRTYNYTTKGGDQTATARGVAMSALLDGYGPKDLVSFSSADDYPVNEDQPMTVEDLISGNYMLAYEIDGASVFDTGTNNKREAVSGCLTLCGDGFKPAKMVNQMTITSNSGIDFSTSEYKHITNGGISGQSGPYNIDAITGATLTIEGPGTEASVPLSVKDMEGRDAGCFRGIYSDNRAGSKVKRTYEGVDLYYILHNMSNGDNGIRMTDLARSVKIKNRNRQTIAELSLEQIETMHEDGRPAIVAYGTAYEDGTDPRPFVFDGGTGGSAELGNEDGCLKFVYDKDRYGGNDNYQTFGNMAYIYVEEEETPGFKHDKAPYDTPQNSQYVLTVTGDEIGREVNYKVEDLEKLVEYDADGQVIDNGYGWRSEYSLANSSYWYVNSYEGVKLWSLLVHSGVDPSKNNDEDTKVTFRSTDNYGGFDVFSLKQVADPDSFGFYEKNAADNNDGTYVPNENIRQGSDVTTGDKLSVGYPVLVSYGVNEYPYVIDRSLDGFLSGLSNDGGPLRVISGKMNYNHANGSNQAKLLDKVIVGSEKYHYSTHAYQPEGSDYAALAENKLDVIIKNGTNKTTRTYTVKELEELLYGGTMPAAQLREAKVKALYETGKAGNYSSDLYEGMNLGYFIRDVLQLQGSQGKITFRSGSKKLTLDLKTVLQLDKGYNAQTKLSDLSGVIAFAKNGYPLVESASSPGYLDKDSLTKMGTSASEPDSFVVGNSGGPLQIVFPRATKKAKETLGSLENVTSIQIDLKPDKYAHVTKPYNKLANKTLTVSGAGTWLTGEKQFTVNDLEGRQSIIQTKDYSIRTSKKKIGQIRYRGLPLYEFLRSTDVGLKTSADQVLIYTAAKPDEPYVFPLADIMKSYLNTKTGKSDLPVMLAFGSSTTKIKNQKLGKPLVAGVKSPGYSKKYRNSGGPLKLVIGQTEKKDINGKKALNNVTRIEVTSGERVSWNHSSSEVFKSYLTDTLNMKVVGKDGTERTEVLTVEQLEGMSDLISQEKIYSTAENTWEGLNFWQLIQSQFADVPGIDDPITIMVRAKDGYSVDAVEKAGLDGLKNGIKDGTNRVPVLLAYGMDGYPLSAGGKSTPIGVGYDSTVDNKGGPLRLMVHNSQGACIMEVTDIIISVGGSVPAKTSSAGLSALAKAESAASISDTARSASTGIAAPMERGDSSVVQAIGAILMPEAAYAGEKNSFTVYEGSGKPGQLPMAGLRSTAMDQAGTLWIGTNGGGVVSLAKGAETFSVINSATTPAIAGTVTYAVCPDDQGGVWISQGSNSGESHGVAYMKDDAISYYSASDGTVASDFVQEVKIDQEGNVWFGTSVGLTKYDPKTDTWKSWGKKGTGSIEAVDFPAESVDNIEIDGDGGLWCGFYPDTNEDGSYTGGFAYFKDGAVVKSYPYVSRKDGNTEYYRMGDVWVRDIAVDPKGGAWAVASGSYRGMENAGGSLWYVSAPGEEAAEHTGFSLVGEEFLNGGKQAQQVNPELRMVTFDEDGGLWFGTSADGVLYVKDPDISGGSLKVTAQFDAEQGFWPGAYDSIYSLDVFDHTLYAGSNSGLAVCDLTKGLPEVNPLEGIVPELTKVKAGKKKATVSWNAVEGAEGYVIYKAAKKTGKYTRAASAPADAVKCIAKKLKKGKTFFKIRTFRTINGTKVWSDYSAPSSAKIK